MGHGITSEDRAAYSNERAWHNIGTVFDHDMTTTEALAAALPWTIDQHPIFVETPTRMIQVHGKFANVRSDTQRVLGIVGERYEAIQNHQVFSFMENLVQDGIVKIEIAGSLWGGATVWVLAKMPERADIRPGDTLEPFILFTNDHTGQSVARVMPTAVRVVCANTVRMALNQHDERAMSIRHVGDVMSKVDVARRIIMRTRDEFNKLADKARLLASVRVTSDSMKLYEDALFPLPEAKTGEELSAICVKRNEQARADFRDAMIREDNVLPNERGTAWAAYNAATYWADHLAEKAYRGTEDENREKRMVDLIDGDSADFKDGALALAETTFLQ